MESTKLFLPLLFIVSLMAGRGLGDHYSLSQHFEPINKLFVFGDSYVDTGNEKFDLNPFLKNPYGITFPGKSDGRYSDGYVLTDYFASFLGLEAPIPYMQLFDVINQTVVDGVNFAFGGAGILDTLLPVPKLTNQINYFEELIDNSTLTKQDINSSMALVCMSINDYLTYLVKNVFHIRRFKQDMKPFIRSMVNNLKADLKRIHSLGVKKVVVASLVPVECVPYLTSLLSYKQCFPMLSIMTDYHNTLLQEAVTELNKEAADDSTFTILDLHRAFSFLIENKGYPEGNITFQTPLKPCCKGLCGEVDAQGNKMYELCEDPKSAFFWDFVHPTHEGWFAAFSYLTAHTLKQSYDA